MSPMGEVLALFCISASQGFFLVAGIIAPIIGIGVSLRVFSRGIQETG